MPTAARAVLGVIAFACVELVFLLAGTHANAAEMVLAPSFPAPTPFAEAMPARAKECVKPDEMRSYLVDMVRSNGGFALVMHDGAQQRFGDAWRAGFGDPAVKLSMSMTWVWVAVVVAEFDDKNCLLTMTVMTGDQYKEILGRMPPAPGAKPVDHSI